MKTTISQNLKRTLGEYDEERIRFLNCQDFDDEIAEGVKIITELQSLAENDTRTAVSISRLKSFPIQKPCVTSFTGWDSNHALDLPILFCRYTRIQGNGAEGVSVEEQNGW